MKFIVSASTDIGISRPTNQDSLSLKVLDTKQGYMVFAILCDGMGGLTKGELASADVVLAFEDWVRLELPVLSENDIDEIIFEQWKDIVVAENLKFNEYYMSHGEKLGTTAVTMLITPKYCYVMNVGDSRAYEINMNGIRQITQDHTFGNRELLAGRMTRQQVESDSRKNKLTECVGGSSVDVKPDFFKFKVQKNSIYLLCSDGFVHKITSEEMYSMFNPHNVRDKEKLNQTCIDAIELNKSRREKDNITVAVIRTGD